MSNPANRPARSWQQFSERWRPSPHNRALWLTIGIAFVLILGELGMRAWEHQQKLDRELTALRKRIQALQISADHVDWAHLSDQLSTAQKSFQDQLWHAPSEAQAQAMLRDWLSTLLKDANITRPTLRLQPVQAVTPTTAASGSQGIEASQQAGDSARLLREAVRARALISFDLAPGNLEAVLQRVERGGQLANVDALSVSKRSRRIEMSISMPVIIEPPESSSAPRPGGASSAPGGKP